MAIPATNTTAPSPTSLVLRFARRMSGPGSAPFWVLAVSGILGVRVGIVSFLAWSIPVESAQVVAGLVRYPADNPFYIYHTKLWTLIIQLCALLLRAGVSEISLSVIISGVVGMLAFQALAMIVCALGRDPLLAVGTAFLVFFTRAAEYGVVYPVFLMGTHHTYGALGLSMFVLIVGLLGSGCYRTGGFLLGLGPAIHPSLGILIGTAIGLSILWDFRTLRREFRPGCMYFAAGCVLTLVSFLVQFSVIYHGTGADPAAIARHFNAFVGFWDDHRDAVSFAHPGVVLNGTALSVALIWLTGFADNLPRSAVFLLRVVAVSAVLGLASVVTSWIAPDRMPMILLTLMPPRLLNFNVVVIAPLLLGLMATYAPRLSSRLLTLVLTAGLLLSQRSRFWEWMQERNWTVWQTRFDPVLVLQVAAVGAVCVAIYEGKRADSLKEREADSSTRGMRAASYAVRLATVGVFLIAALLTWRLQRPAELRDRTNDPLFAAVAAERKGLLVTAGSFQLVQLYTRRPVLVDSGALDTMVYAPETGPAMARILQDVYGVDLFNPPPEVRGASAIPHDLNRRIWAQFPRLRWQEIGHKYNVTQVLARAEYTLDLPVAAENDWLRLYRIP